MSFFIDCSNLLCSLFFQTKIEVATGKFPYPMWATLFDQLNQVVRGDPPQLKSTVDQTFTEGCLHSAFQLWWITADNLV